MSDFAPTRTDYRTTDRRCFRDFLRLNKRDVTLDGSLFPSATFPDGLVKAGTYVGVTTGSKLGGPYSNAAADGRETARGVLVNDVVVKAGRKFLTAIAYGGSAIDRRFLPANSGRDAAAEADLPALPHIN